MHRDIATRWLGIAALLAALAPGAPAAAGDAAPGSETLRDEMEALRQQNEELRESMDSLRREVRSARDEALAARDMAAAHAASAPAGYVPAGYAPVRQEPRPGIQIGRANLQLLDLSLDVLAAAGWSEAEGETLRNLQGGNHDPRQRGFTLQQVELGFVGAVDPYFTAESYLLYFIDAEGESRFELEEAFVTTQMLPFGLEEHGLQLELGQFFTEFGRLNPQHPHTWDWQDQPVVLSRFFGEDGVRQTGARLGWLTPLPWYSEVHLGVQNAVGETMVSFLANDEVFEERPIGGRPFTEDGRLSDPDDLTYLARWVNGFDITDTWSAQLGGSALFGPNGTGEDGRTWIAGADAVLKWRPLSTDRGWPFVVLQGEVLYRRYEADDFFGCPPEEEGCAAADFVRLDERSLDDLGLYAQMLWGFTRNWAAGIRYEFATGHGDNVEFDEGAGRFVDVSHNTDPFRSTRHRVSPLLAFHPSEFSRLRLQYNFDHVKHLEDETIHSVWAGIEFLFGSHPTHTY